MGTPRELPWLCRSPDSPPQPLSWEPGTLMEGEPPQRLCAVHLLPWPAAGENLPRGETPGFFFLFQLEFSLPTWGQTDGAGKGTRTNRRSPAGPHPRQGRAPPQRGGPQPSWLLCSARRRREAVPEQGLFFSSYNKNSCLVFFFLFLSVPAGETRYPCPFPHPHPPGRA